MLVKLCTLHEHINAPKSGRVIKTKETDLFDIQKFIIGTMLVFACVVFKDGLEFALKCYVTRIYTMSYTKSGSSVMFDVLESLVEKNVVSARQVHSLKCDVF